MIRVMTCEMSYYERKFILNFDTLTADFEIIPHDDEVASVFEKFLNQEREILLGVSPEDGAVGGYMTERTTIKKRPKSAFFHFMSLYPRTGILLKIPPGEYANGTVVP